MCDFYKYPSIVNIKPSDIKKFSNEYVYVKEKVHGSNFVIVVGESDIKFGKRGGYLGDDSNFYDWKKIRDKYKECFSKLYGMLKNDVENIDKIYIYSEIYGGQYPHPEIKNNTNSKVVQKRVWYSPFIDIIIYDVFVGTPVNRWINWSHIEKICQQCELRTVPTIHRGILSEILDKNKNINEITSLIPGLHGLPLLEKNIGEGVILKFQKPPDNDIILDDFGKTYKWKHPNFEEVAFKKNQYDAKTKLSVEEFNELRQRAILYINENRVLSYISKITLDELIDKSQFGTHIKEIVKDAFEDFIKDISDTEEERDKKNIDMIWNAVKSNLGLHAKNYLVSEIKSRSLNTL